MTDAVEVTQAAREAVADLFIKEGGRMAQALARDTIAGLRDKQT